VSETITARISRWASELTFGQLSEAAINAAKRSLLDSIGCALGGYRQPDVEIALEVMEEQGGDGPATVIGAGRKMDLLSATLLNALMVRVLDYNDIYWMQDPSHPSDIIPAAIACGERAGRNGRELIVGMVLGYEFEMRLCEAAHPGIRDRGWHHATLTAFVSPIVAARMLGLDWKTMQHAIGISGACMTTLGAVTAGKLTMMKNMADPMAVRSGVLAALLAERGFSGPEHVIDGKEGLAQCMGPEWKLECLEQGLGDGFRITDCGLKAYPTEALTHAPASCTLNLVTEHGLRPEHIEKIHIRASVRATDILADPSKYDPRSKETADHSLPYVVAAAVADRRLTPAQFTDDRIKDPCIRKLLPRVEVTADPGLDALFPRMQRVIVTIRTTDGRELTDQTDYPKGNPHNPMSNAEIEEKFDALAEPLLDAGRRSRIKETIWSLEKLDSIGDLMDLLS
jgi:2-methylcitrate dehydratase